MPIEQNNNHKEKNGSKKNWKWIKGRNTSTKSGGEAGIIIAKKDKQNEKLSMDYVTTSDNYAKVMSFLVTYPPALKNLTLG